MKTTTPRIVRATDGAAIEIQNGLPHTVRTIDAEGRVALEVLDWGGTGPAMILLAGLGNSAHIFDDFASAFEPRS